MLAELTKFHLSDEPTLAPVKSIDNDSSDLEYLSNYTFLLVPAILLMMGLVPALPALASYSDDADSDDTGPSCSPVTGNPFQEKCGKDGLQGHPTERGDIFCGHEDTVTGTPQVCINR